MTDKKEDEIEKIYELISLSESGECYNEALSLSVVYAQSPRRWLRVNALHCFGYIARVYGRLDVDVALPLIRKGEMDADPEVAAAARDALDDLEHFLPGFKLEFGHLRRP